MALRFIAKDPNTQTGQSPTAWVDEENADLVLQGWRADGATQDECRETGPVPDHETVIRIPARMVPAIREACDVAEQRARLR
ncbi:hypothetical protein CTZ27_19680 [Streptomyces griseocarneus]|nr:hypothetical protein CTZ27_19680 [Streptomyces griseocarneus]